MDFQSGATKAMLAAELGQGAGRWLRDHTGPRGLIGPVRRRGEHGRRGGHAEGMLSPSQCALAWMLFKAGRYGHREHLAHLVVRAWLTWGTEHVALSQVRAALAVESTPGSRREQASVAREVFALFAGSAPRGDRARFTRAWVAATKDGDPTPLKAEMEAMTAPSFTSPGGRELGTADHRRLHELCRRTPIGRPFSTANVRVALRGQGFVDIDTVDDELLEQARSVLCLATAFYTERRPLLLKLTHPRLSTDELFAPDLPTRKVARNLRICVGVGRESRPAFAVAAELGRPHAVPDITWWPVGIQRPGWWPPTA